MGYELWLSVRYLLAKRRERFVSLIALLSIGGVALGVTALIVVLSVMSGFDFDLKDKLIGTSAHVTVESPQDLRDIEPVIRTIAGTAHVTGVSPYIIGQAIVRLPDRAFGVAVRGIDPEREAHATKLREYVVLGRLPRNEQDVLIGTELAKFTGAGVGQPFRLISPADGKLHELVVCGIFRSGMYEYDAGLVAVAIPRAQALFALSGTVSGLAVRVDRVEEADRVKAALAAKLGPPYVVKTWSEQNPALFGALRVEKIMMFIIVMLIVAVAALNIVSMLIMVVTEKTKDIGILRSVGATQGSVATLFLLQGCIIGGLGTLAGLAGGLALSLNLNAISAWLETTFGISVFPSSIYYLDHIPARVDACDVSIVVGSAFLLTLLAGIYPAIRAARLSPVDALRYE